MLNIPANFKNHLVSRDTQLSPVIVIGNFTTLWDGSEIYISTEKVNINVAGSIEGETLPLLLNMPSIKENFDINSRKYKISSLNLQFSNVEYGGKRLSERFSGSMINTEVRIYWSAPNSKGLVVSDVGTNYDDDSMIEVYYGKIRRYTHDTKKLTLAVEDNSQDTFHKDLPIETVSSKGFAPEKYIGKYVPIVYGVVHRSPCVFDNNFDSVVAGDQITAWRQEANPFYCEHGANSDNLRQALWQYFTPIWIWTGSDYVNLAQKSYKINTDVNMTLGTANDPLPDGGILQILPDGYYQNDDLTNEYNIRNEEKFNINDRNFKLNLKSRTTRTIAEGYDETEANEEILCFVWDFSSDLQYNLVVRNEESSSYTRWEVPEGSLGKAFGGRFSQLWNYDGSLPSNDVQWTGQRAINYQDFFSATNRWINNPTNDDSATDPNVRADHVLFYRSRKTAVDNKSNYLNIEFHCYAQIEFTDAIGYAQQPEYNTLTLQILTNPSSYETGSKDSDSFGNPLGYTEDVYGMMINGHNISYLMPIYRRMTIFSPNTNPYEGTIIQSNYLGGNFGQETVQGQGELRNHWCDMVDWKSPISDKYFEQMRATELISTHNTEELMDVFRFKSRDGGQAENTLNIDNAAIHIKHEIAFDEEPNSDANPATIRTSLDMDGSNLKEIKLLRLGTMLNPFKFDFYANVGGRTNIDGSDWISSPNEIVNDVLTEYLDLDKSIDVDNTTGKGWASTDLRDANVYTPDNWNLDFTVNKKIHSKKLIEDICSVTPFIPYFSNMGNFKFTDIRYNHGSTPRVPIKANDIISFNFNRTDIEDVYNEIEIKYGWDYAKEEYTRKLNSNNENRPLTVDDLLIFSQSAFQTSQINYKPFFDYSLDYYGLDNKRLTVESKHLDRDKTANMAASMLLSWHCNQHLVFKLTLPLKYMDVEIGDFIKFDKLIGNIAPYNIDYIDAEDNDVYVNGQLVYNAFMVTGTNKTTKHCEITCIQYHALYIDKALNV